MMNALEVNRAIGKMFGYLMLDHSPDFGTAYAIQREGAEKPNRHAWLSNEQSAWAERSPNWAFNANEAIKLITGDERFNIQVQRTGFRVKVRDADIDIYRKDFAHAISEAWYRLMITEAVR